MSIQIKVLYSISHPLTNVIVYIGQTNDLYRRTLEHYRGTQKIDEWMRALRNEGLEPVIKVISRHHKRINKTERAAIIRAKRFNQNLLNCLIPVNA